MIERIVTQLIDRIEGLESLTNQLDRRISNIIREGKVTEVDPATGTAKVETNGIVSPSMPWVQRAGDILEWDPPTVGERVMVFSPSGDVNGGIVMPGGFSETFKPNHNVGGAKRTSIGDASITQTADGFILSAGGTTFNFTAAGFVQNGGEQRHEGKDVGATHKHSGVAPGGALTDVPV